MVESGLSSVNIEITTQCPIGCPFCYCRTDKHHHMDIPKAIYWVNQAALHGVTTVMLSGGEPMCYPHLEEVVHEAHQRCGHVVLSTSGYGLTKEKLHSLRRAGLDGIFVSLNGSVEEIHSKSRNGFHLTMSALELIRQEHFHQFAINYVLMRNNADDFDNMLALAEQYGADTLSVLALKPDVSNHMESPPTQEQLCRIAAQIANHQGKCDVYVEGCYPELVRLVRTQMQKKGLISNLVYGCNAGVHTFSVGIDGKVAPCRHLPFSEERETLEDYLRNSTVLETLRHQRHESEITCAAVRMVQNP